jgi:vitamin B12 transporter
MRNIVHRVIRSVFTGSWMRRRSGKIFSENRAGIIIFLLVACFYQAGGAFHILNQDTVDIKMKYSLEEVKVAASKMMSINSQMARILSVIDSVEIELAPAESLESLLEYLVMIDVRQRGAEGVQSDIGIRGGTFDQTLILLNGVNITDPQTGHHNLNLPVSLSQIERIELLKGSDAAIYGPNAFSGAINIVTKKPAGNSATLSLYAGSFGYVNADMLGDFMTRKLSHSLSGNYKRSKGYTDNTDFNISNFFYSGRYDSKGGILTGQIGASGKAFGANSFYTPEYPDQFEKIGTSFMSLRWESLGRLHITPVIYKRRHFDKFMLFRGDAPDWYKGHNYHRTDVWGANISSWFLWNAGKTSFSALYRSESIVSTVLGEKMDTGIKVPGEDIFYTHSKSRSTASLFIEHTCYAGKWIIGAGGLASFIPENAPMLKILPDFDIDFHICPWIMLGASWSASSRMPTFTDLYYSGPDKIGNAELKAEISNSFEGELNVNTNYITGNLAVFYRSGQNMIDWIKNENDKLWQSHNLTRINSLGTEMRLQVRLKENLKGNWPDKITIGWYSNKQNKETSDFISYYVLDYLKYKFTASVNQSITKYLFLNLRSYFQKREGTFTNFGDNNYREVSYKPFWLFDAKILFKKENLQIFISSNNIFNKEYFDIGNIVQPGRWIKTGILYKFNLN